MLNMFRSRHLTVVFCIFLLAAVLVLFSGCDKDADQIEGSEQLPSYKVQGPVKVFYDVQISDTEAFGTGSTPVEAKEILLFDKYVVIPSKDGSTRLLPVNKIKYMNWHRY